MTDSEISAFSIAKDCAAQRGLPWLPPFSVYLEGAEWIVSAEADFSVSVRVSAGRADVSFPKLDGVLDPLEAFTQAKAYALERRLNWKPGFTLSCDTSHWTIGSCQSQFGGQVRIYVAHDGTVLGSDVNPK